MHSRIPKLLVRCGMIATLSLLISLVSLGHAYAQSTQSAHITKVAHTDPSLGQSNLGPTIVYQCPYPPTDPPFDGPYVVYVGTDNQINLYDTFDRTDWLSQQYTLSTPGVVCFNNTLYFAFRDAANNRIDIGYFYAQDAPMQMLTSLPDTTLSAPTLTRDVSRLYLGWVGTDSGHHLNIAQSTNGVTWTNKWKAPNDDTVDGAGFTLSGDYKTGAIYASWVSCCSTPTINLALYSGNKSWSWKQTFTSDWSPFAPTMTATNGTIEFLFKGGTSQTANDNLYTNYWSGFNWHTSIKQKDTTAYAPALDGTIDPSTLDLVLVTTFTGTSHDVWYDLNAYKYGNN